MKNDNWSLREYVNPCTKCGSVECAVCWKDISILREKLVEDCFKIFEDRGKTISGHTFKDIINKRFGIETQ